MIELTGYLSVFAISSCGALPAALLATFLYNKLNKRFCNIRNNNLDIEEYLDGRMQAFREQLSELYSSKAMVRGLQFELKICEKELERITKDNNYLFVELKKTEDKERQENEIKPPSDIS